MGGRPAFWGRDGPTARLLAPLGTAYAAVARRRRRRYRQGHWPVVALPAGVIVVGNLCVGGTGKTPLAAWIAERAAAQGHAPGIVARGYRARASHPRRVEPTAGPAEVGDEPLLLARRTGLPVAVGVDRAAAAELLVEAGCDLIVADDGLQHYRLARDVEIVVIDAGRRLGNRRCLPAGPLREPPERLAEADLVVAKGGAIPETPFWFTLTAGEPVAVGEPSGAPPAPGARVHAVAGVGNPEGFFATLRERGLEVIPHPFPDHHRYRRTDLAFADGLPLVMTEKDAIKCAGLADAWVLPVAALPEPATARRLDELIVAAAAAGRERRAAG